MNINRGDIWYVENTYSAVGSEQRPGRPAIIVSNDANNRNSGTVEVVYLTTQPKKDLPTHVTIHSTGRTSLALCEQITSISTERIGDYCGKLTDAEMSAVENAILISLGFRFITDRDLPVKCEETPPIPDTRLAEVEARCRVLQEMYDALLDRLVKAG